MKFLKQLWNKFRSLKIWQKAIVLILILTFIGSVVGSSDSTPTSEPSLGSQTTAVEPEAKSTLDKLNDSSVNWNNYAPAVKQRIAEYIDASDCTNLQVEFDNADNNNDNQRNRTGESNAELMTLLDSQLRKLSCY